MRAPHVDASTALASRAFKESRRQQADASVNAVESRGDRPVFIMSASYSPARRLAKHSSPGGVLITVDGKITGAVGVSGATGDQDEQCAKAGLGS
jgi:hypothetical protein